MGATRAHDTIRQISWPQEAWRVDAAWLIRRDSSLRPADPDRVLADRSTSVQSTRDQSGHGFVGTNVGTQADAAAFGSRISKDLRQLKG